MKLVFLLFIYCFVSFADCSRHVGSVQINELFVGQNDKSSSENWIELKLNSSNLNTAGWRLQISQSAKLTQIVPISSLLFDINGNFLTTTTPIRLSRNSLEQTNIVLFDEVGNSVDSITIFGKDGNGRYQAQNQVCEQFSSSDFAVSAFADGGSQTYFDDIERINDGRLWLSWKNLSSKNSPNLAINNTGTYAKEYTMEAYNTARKTLRSVVAGEAFQITVQSNLDLVASNRIVAIGSDDGCKNANINLSCTQTTLPNNVLSTKLDCKAPNSAHKQVWIKILNGRAESCSSDSFSIRPAMLTIDMDVQARAGEEVVNLRAVDKSGEVVLGYDSQLCLNATTNKTSCPITKPLKDKMIEMKNSVTSFAIDEVGDMNVTARDSIFTVIDSGGDCIANSDTSEPNSDGLVGCNISGQASIIVLPFAFDVLQGISNQNANSRTYRYGGDLENMSAKISFGIKAVGKSGSITKNFSQGCYEELIKISSAISNVDELGAVALFSNPFTDFLPCGFSTGWCQVSANDSRAIKLNFKKPSEPKNPLVVKAEQIKLEIMDTNGTNIRNVQADNNATAQFVYAKNGVSYSAGVLRLEASFYDTNTTRALANGLVKSSENSDFWVNNEDSFSYFDIKTGKEIVDTAPMSVQLSNSSGYFANGMARIVISSATSQYQKFKLHINIPAYLWDKEQFGFEAGSSCAKHPCQSIELFSSNTIWLGQGVASDKAIGKLPKGTRREHK